ARLTVWRTLPEPAASAALPLSDAVSVCRFSVVAGVAVVKRAWPLPSTGTAAARMVFPSRKVGVPVPTGLPPLPTLAVKEAGGPSAGGLSDEVRGAAVARAVPIREGSSSANLFPAAAVPRFVGRMTAGAAEPQVRLAENPAQTPAADGAVGVPLGVPFTK